MDFLKKTKKFLREIKFNQKVLLKPYIDMNTTLREKVKKNFKKYFFRLINNADIWEKTCNNGKKKKLFNMRTKLLC